jgi:hypothetical protein
VLALTRREGTAHTWRQALLPTTIGLALAFIIIGGVDAARYFLTQALGLPF